jgi:Fic-DOC domain mobile mystery protein B
VTDLFDEPEGATPLEPSERRGLRQTWITSRHDLNEAEQENIVKGANWARRRRRASAADWLDEKQIKMLHERMFGDVWSWAGAYRNTERNIGVAAYRIPVEMAAMLGDVRYWVGHGAFPGDEIAIRLHHRLTQIHPFSNGNGRHARLIADLVIERHGGEIFSWGGGSLFGAGELRARYVAALRAADGHDIAPLLVFARS